MHDLLPRNAFNPHTNQATRLAAHTSISSLVSHNIGVTCSIVSSFSLVQVAWYNMGRPRRESSKNLKQAKLLADRIKALRNRLNLTQEQLAQKSGLSVYTISRLERGERVDPSVFTVDALAQKLDTTVDGLLHGPRNGPKSAR
jgi:DNA-binding XRE family transcriptional regulator